MEEHTISRKKFLGLGAAATGAALFSGIGGNAVAKVLPEENKTALNEYLLMNVRLEDGFEYNDKNEVIATKTALYTIHIANGKISIIIKTKLVADFFNRQIGTGEQTFGFKNGSLSYDITCRNL